MGADRARRLAGRRRLATFFAAAIVVLLAGAPAPLADIVVPLPIQLPFQIPGISFASGPTGGAPITKPKPKGHKASVPAALTRRAMWIWYVSRSGTVSSIIAAARQYGIGTLMIKSGDGSSYWSQFSPTLISELHAAGLKVCAWQYVYGNHPVAEAQVSAQAVTSGADCFMIDAEGDYEGKYIQAQAYLTELRSLIGASFPVALAGLPYMDYHPAFPYSVFLGPGGAQYNAPQMYWYDIGTTVDGVYMHTYMYNRLYGRPIVPIGEVTGPPPPRQILRFRQLSRAYGAASVSWWDWQDATVATWLALARPVGSLASYAPTTSAPTIKRGSKGDLVVWAQQHLITAIQRLNLTGLTLTVDGAFGPQTETAVANFQTAKGLSATGIVDLTTWHALLQYAVAPIKWGKKGTRRASIARGPAITPVPMSASLPAVRYEIPRKDRARR
jgi:hypothetical protein